MTEDMDMNAGEYVLGTLDPAERSAFERSMAVDPQLVAAVAYWRGVLAAMDADAPEIMPSAGLWHRIDAAIRPVAANDNRVARGWRTMAMAAALIAAISSGLAVRGWQRPERAPLNAVASLTPDGTTPALLVGWRSDSRRYEVRPLALPAKANRVYQLWLIADGAGPRSMGLVGAQSRWVEGSGLRPGQSATIAVSVEPIGGSPTGAPTGPVVYSGKLIALPDTV